MGWVVAIVSVRRGRREKIEREEGGKKRGRQERERDREETERHRGRGRETEKDP